MSYNTEIIEEIVVNVLVVITSIYLSAEAAHEKCS